MGRPRYLFVPWLQLLVLEPRDPSIPPVLHSLNVAVRDGVVVVLTALNRAGFSRELVLPAAVAAWSCFDGSSTRLRIPLVGRGRGWNAAWSG